MARYTKYVPCKCGNEKGIVEEYKENDWGSDEFLSHELVCEDCKDKYSLKREYVQHYKGWSHSYHVYNFIPKSKKTSA
jgi:hypothetical protein